MPQLLVSIRSVAEAEAALHGGARLIDIKEPKRGSLGRASDNIISEVIAYISKRRKISAAMGEIRHDIPAFSGPGLVYAKWGLSGCGSGSNWIDRLTVASNRLAQSSPETSSVFVSYADWQLASAPEPEEICQSVCHGMSAGLLLDTWRKNGPTLLDWLSVERIKKLRDQCRDAGKFIALAGSLGEPQIRKLLTVEPDWFAVRGACCRDRCRTKSIDPCRVSHLAKIIGQPKVATVES